MIRPIRHLLSRRQPPRTSDIARGSTTHRTYRSPSCETLERRELLSADFATFSSAIPESLVSSRSSTAALVGPSTVTTLSASDSAATGRSVAAAQKAWTVMVYMDGDNNLEQAAIDDFLEMASVNNPNVNIVVQFDRWSDPIGSSQYGDWTSTKRFLVRPGMTPTASNALYDLGEQNMGAPSTLANFVIWARSFYPADREALVIWNHGGGWQDGIAFDGNDSLTMPELRRALRSSTANGTDPLNVVVMDACLMGGLEVAAELQGMARYFVASPDLVNWDGLEYQVILKPQVLTPNTSPRVWTQQIVASFASRYDAYDSADTLMAADMRFAPNVGRELSDLADALTANLNAERAQIRVAFQQTRHYAPDYTTAIDLNQFCRELIQRSRTQSVRQAAQAVVQSLKDMIVDVWNDPQFAHTANSQRGLSIYFPRNAFDYDFGSYTGKKLSFLADTSQHWDNFLIAYLGKPVYARSDGTFQRPTIMAARTQTGSEGTSIDATWTTDGLVAAASETPIRRASSTVATTTASVAIPHACATDQVFGDLDSAYRRDAAKQAHHLDELVDRVCLDGLLDDLLDIGTIH